MLKSGENCGGPLICSKCAMKWAQKYYDVGKLEWAEIYRSYSKKIRQTNEQRTN